VCPPEGQPDPSGNAPCNPRQSPGSAECRGDPGRSATRSWSAVLGTGCCSFAGSTYRGDLGRPHPQACSCRPTAIALWLRLARHRLPASSRATDIDSPAQSGGLASRPSGKLFATTYLLGGTVFDVAERVYHARHHLEFPGSLDEGCHPAQGRGIRGFDRLGF